MHINIQSITNKLDALEQLCNAHQVDIVCLSEHWLHKENHTLYNLQGYNWISKYVRRTGIHGGAGILCRGHLNATPVDGIADMSVDTHCEVSAAHIPGAGLLVLAVYRSCLGDLRIFCETFEGIMDFIFEGFALDVGILVCGDFNVNWLRRQTIQGNYSV